MLMTTRSGSPCRVLDLSERSVRSPVTSSGAITPNGPSARPRCTNRVRIGTTPDDMHAMRERIARKLSAPHRGAERVRHHLEEEAPVLADVLVSKVHTRRGRGTFRRRVVPSIQDVMRRGRRRERALLSSFGACVGARREAKMPRWSGRGSGYARASRAAHLSASAALGCGDQRDAERGVRGRQLPDADPPRLVARKLARRSRSSTPAPSPDAGRSDSYDWDFSGAVCQLRAETYPTTLVGDNPLPTPPDVHHRFV